MRDLGKILKGAGFQRIGTGAYEGDAQTMKDLTDLLRQVCDFIDGMDGVFKIDHLWIYADSTS